jgi:hypothetical protein
MIYMRTSFCFVIGLLVLAGFSAHAQSDRFMSARGSLHFNFGLKAPGQDELQDSNDKKAGHEKKHPGRRAPGQDAV